MSCNNVQILNFNHNVVEVGSDNKLIITDNVRCNSITIPQPVTNILQINSPGPQGPAGTGGGGGSLSGGINNYIPLWSGSTALTSSIASQQTGSITFNTPSVNVNNLTNWAGDNDQIGSIDIVSFFGYTFISSTTSSITLDGDITTTLFDTFPLPQTWTNITLTDNSNNVLINDPYYNNILSITFYSQSFDGVNYTTFYSSSTSPGTVLPNTIYTSVTNILPSIYINNDLRVSGSIYGYLNGTASWANTSLAPISVKGNTLYSTTPLSTNSPNTNGSIFLGGGTGDLATNAALSQFIGIGAGYNATNANYSTFIGHAAGVNSTNANNSIFIGSSAGNNATNAFYSNFIGDSAGSNNAVSASYSNFLGYQAGYAASKANNSNFIGNNAGRRAVSASYSTLIGYKAGYIDSGTGISSNNIIIGTGITLPNGAKDSINLGGIIFATGSYFSTSSILFPSFSGSANGKVGINVVSPNYTLDVSGSGNYTNGLTITGSTQGNVTALSISSNTASLNLSSGSFFTLQLVSGSNTYINPSNIVPGLTATLLISTTGSATVTFPGTVKTGSAYTPTTTTGKDILTFISFDSTNLYLAAVKNLG